MKNLFSFKAILICKIDTAEIQSFFCLTNNNFWYYYNGNYYILFLTCCVKRFWWAYEYGIHYNKSIFMSNFNGTFKILIWYSVNCIQVSKMITDLIENHKETISVWSAVKCWCSMVFFCDCGFYSFLEIWLWMCTLNMSITFPWLWRKSKQLGSQNLAWTSS